ncbi:hypothetical protein O6P43_001232 [Quillaja saponaria]|uniref:Uncharacterized protein n=1 Tax=Quillaja saponaria TaxID=32244 RepID=A0AAD7VNE0_QUISA|nr:hypothetical protein O6P43_001232 [Quillaja saponaria]
MVPRVDGKALGLVSQSLGYLAERNMVIFLRGKKSHIVKLLLSYNIYNKELELTRLPGSVAGTCDPSGGNIVVEHWFSLSSQVCCGSFLACPFQAKSLNHGA